jgi:hypothetical protein
MWRMWDEQVWFVGTSVMIAVAWIIRDRLTYGGKTNGPRWPWIVAALSAVVLGIVRYTVICYQQKHWEPLGRRGDGEWVLAHWVTGPNLQEVVPDAGLFLTLALGMLFGVAFGAAFSALLRGKASAQSLWAGALALLAVSVGYSMPVYHREIAGLLRDSGLSSLKISIADITLEAALAAKGNRGEVSASGGASGSTTQLVERLTDPTPGLQALYYDLIGDVKAKEKDQRNIIVRDESYVKTLRGAQSGEFVSISKIKHQTEIFLKPLILLTKCLDEYRKIIPDAQLLLIDISSSISPLFVMHKRFLQTVMEITADPYHSLSLTNSDRTYYDNYVYLIKSADTTIDSVIRTLNSSGAGLGPIGRQCQEAKNTLSAELAATGAPMQAFLPPLSINQPYVTIALAWLLKAHGAPDEAASVLAEWLESSEQLDRYNGDHIGLQSMSIPEWYRIDILARLQTILKDVAGNNNRAFRAVLNHYRNVLANYLGSVVPPIQLDQIAARCAEWSKKATDLKNAAAAAAATAPEGPTDVQNAVDDLDARRGLAFVLWGTEVDALRTELNFIPEINSFESVEALRRRAGVTGQMTPGCLPQAAKPDPPEGWPDEFRTFGPTYNVALVADSMVTAGLVSFAAGERMSALGRSPTDRERAEKARKEGEDWLITGWADLEPIWRRQSAVRDADATSWPDRIFGGTEWDKTASLALRVLSRLHQGE